GFPGRPVAVARTLAWGRAAGPLGAPVGRGKADARVRAGRRYSAAPPDFPRLLSCPLAFLSRSRPCSSVPGRSGAGEDGRAVGGLIGRPVGGAVGGAVRRSIGGAVGGPVGRPVGGAVGGPVRGAVGRTVGGVAGRLVRLARFGGRLLDGGGFRPRGRIGLAPAADGPVRGGPGGGGRCLRRAPAGLDPGR